MAVIRECEAIHKPLVTQWRVAACGHGQLDIVADDNLLARKAAW